MTDAQQQTEAETDGAETSYEDDVDTSHLDDVDDGCGCAEVWEHLSDEREAQAD